MSVSVLPMVSSKNCIVFGLTFRSFSHFKFIVVYDVRKCSSFILLYIVDWFPQHYLLKETVFSPMYIFASFVKDKVSISVWIYPWTFYSFPLIYSSVLCQDHTVLMTVAL